MLTYIIRFVIINGEGAKLGGIEAFSWLGGSVVERRCLIGELSLVCTGPAADG